MAELLANNAASKIVGSVGASDTSISITAGDGAKFPAPSGADFFRVIAINLTTGDMELMKVTDNTSDTFTVTRAVEDIAGEVATAHAFNDGDEIYHTPTAASYASFAQTTDIQDGSVSGADATGAADTYTVALNPALSGYTDRMIIRWDPSATNTGPSTLDAGDGALAIKKMKNGSVVDVEAGDIVNAVPLLTMHVADATPYWLIVSRLFLRDGEVTTSKLGSASVSTPKLKDAVVTTPKLADDAVTLAKMNGGTAHRAIAYDASGNPIESGGVLPVGACFYYAWRSPPPGSLTRDGSAISRTTYSALFNVLTFTETTVDTSNGSDVISMDDTGRVSVGDHVEGPGLPAGTISVTAIISSIEVRLSDQATATQSNVTFRFFRFGSGDGSSTFNLPDDRGEFERGWDIGRGVDSGRGFGSTQSHQYTQHSHGPGSLSLSSRTTNNTAGTANGAIQTDVINSTITLTGGNTAAAGGTENTSETRPRNRAYLPCIKY